MPSPNVVTGMPGVRTARSAIPRLALRDGIFDYLSQGRIIDGAQSRDVGNTGDLDVLRAGLLMGKITSSGKYAPAVVGAITGAYTSGGTELTVSAAAAVELDRLVGQAGTGELIAIGPPSAAGTVAATAFDHSAINTTTGVITVTSLGVNKIAGTLIAVNDGRSTPISLIPDGYGIKVTDGSGTSLDEQWPDFPAGGIVLTANLLPVWPSDTSLRSWIETSLKTHGTFVLDAYF